MEEFTGLMELERLGVGVSPSVDVDNGVYILSDVKQDRIEDIFQDVLESPLSETGGLGEEWMEQSSLSEMLEELSGMATDMSSSTASPVKSNSGEDEFMESMELQGLELDGESFDLLQELAEKANLLNFEQPLDSSDVSSGQVAVELYPLDNVPINSETKYSTLAENILVDLDLTSSEQSKNSEVESLLSSSPSSPSSSVSGGDSSICSGDSESELLKLMTRPSHKYTPQYKSSPYQRKDNITSKYHIHKPKVKSVATDCLEIDFLSKKDKKKLQNKNAAIRYRQKKKVEAEEIKKEEDELEEVNKKLSEKVEELQREILYMKNLMNDVYKARTNVKLTKVSV